MKKGDFRCVELYVQGLMPERAIAKLRRTGITLYHIKKAAKDRLDFSVEKKDEPKVYTVYPPVLYQGNGYEKTAYRIGVLRKTDPIKNLFSRMGLLIGGILFLTATCLSNRFIFRIEIVGAEGLETEIRQVLCENGIEENAYYVAKDNASISAKILCLDGVAFCSVKKLGTALRVEVQRAPFQKPTKKDGDMFCMGDGKLISLTVLSGTPLKKMGDDVRTGEKLVGAYLTYVDGEVEKTIPTHVVARAVVSCVYEREIAADSPDCALAKARFDVFGSSVAGTELITKKDVVKTEKGFFVTLEYTAYWNMNFDTGE